MIYKNKVKEITNDEQFILLNKYVDLIEKHNKVMNLTGFSGDRLWKEGIYESIVSLDAELKNKKGKLLDIGAGAGFPSVPYIIFNKEIELTIYESQTKRVNFLELVKKELGLSFKINNIRMEESKENNEFDFITARAVASLNILIKASYHLGNSNCLFTFIKGPKHKEEIKQAQKDINNLSLKVSSKRVLEVVDKEIYMVSFNKGKETPKNWPLEWKEIKNC